LHISRKIPSEEENYQRFGTRPNGNPKFFAGYLVPLRLIWQGELYQEKEIDVNPDSSLQVGKTLQLNASVRTKDFGSTSWSNWVSVAASPETKWESENESIAVVSATGVVTAKAVGTVNIRATWKSGFLKITAKCNGKTIETDWIATKTLIVTGPTKNGPPVFDAGFFHNADTSSFEPLTIVAVNTALNLRIINDPRSVPAKPYDPDGDPIYYNWDFAGSDSAWIRSFPTEYGAYPGDEIHRNLVAKELGYHCVKVTARDPYSASTTKTVCIYVVPPNPIPIIDGPIAVVEGRPLPFPFDGSRSFSPMGRSISQYIWENVKSVYTEPGTEYITLEVIDSGGLRSRPEDKAVHALTVKPDLPPIPDLEYVNVSVRNTEMRFTDKSYSPDGDQIVEHIIRWVCDLNNNGSFDDDIKKTITPNEDGEFAVTPTQVGNCAITIFLKEDWGKTAEKSFPLKVLNLAPEADFTAVSVNPEPPQITTFTPTMNTIMNSEEWSASSISENTVAKNYVLNTTTNTLETRGNENFQPYRSITMNNVTISQQEMHRNWCGDCGNEGSTSGYYFSFDPAQRVDRRLWRDGNTFYHEDRTTTGYKSGYSGPVLSFLRYADNYNIVINPITKTIWHRSHPVNDFRTSHTWTDRIYRFNDILLGTPVDLWGEHIVEPYYSQNQTVYSSNPTFPNQVQEPAAPSMFTMPPVIQDEYMTVTQTNATTGNPMPDKTLLTRRKVDMQGNVFKNNCLVVINEYTCSLQKFAPDGTTQLWEHAASASTLYVAVEYVSTNNETIVVSETHNNIYKVDKNYKIVNNNNGSTILTLTPSIPDSYYYADTKWNQNVDYYLGVFHDTVAFISQTVDPDIFNRRIVKLNATAHP
jgi:hypothetical protein